MTDEALAAEGAVPRPRLLFLSQTLPFPPNGGVKVRTFNVLRLLARAFDITALCFFRREQGVSSEDVAAYTVALQSFGNVSSFPIPQEHSRLRLIWDHLRSVVSSRAYTAFTYESHDYRQALKAVLERERFDLVHADSLDLSRFFPLVSHLPIVCTHHDATSVQLSRRADREGGRLRSAYVQHQARLMAKEEREWCKRVQLNAVVSSTDLGALRSLAPYGRFVVVPNGVDTDYFQPEERDTEGLVCVGPTNWFPNRDALDHLASDILPHLRLDGASPNVRWIGWCRPEEREEFARLHQIELTGRVPDIRPYVKSAACYVVPIRAGGGTRVKILDAWAMGKAVVSTSVGCEGLDVVHGENILVHDDPSEFAAAVGNVLRNDDLRSRLGAAARRTVEEKYSWDVIGREMIGAYHRVLNGWGAV